MNQIEKEIKESRTSLKEFDRIFSWLFWTHVIAICVSVYYKCTPAIVVLSIFLFMVLVFGIIILYMHAMFNKMVQDYYEMMRRNSTAGDN